MNQSIVYTYTRITKTPRMTPNMLEIARINQEARDRGMTYGSYVAGSAKIVGRKHAGSWTKLTEHTVKLS